MATKRMPIGEFVKELEAAMNRKDGYIMGATGQDPKKWSETSWWYTQYNDSATKKAKALYWRENAKRVWDCNGLAEGIYKDWCGNDINTKARYNYSGWCHTKGTGTIPVQHRVPGAAVFWGNQASTITHVAYLYEPVVAGKPDGDWFIIEARGVLYGVVKTKMSSRKPNFWGIMDKYFDYGDMSTESVIPNTGVPRYALGDRLLKKGMKGEDVKELQEALNKLGYSCGTPDGDFGANTDEAVRKFQRAKGLVVDGQYGAKSHEAMKLALSSVSDLIEQVPAIGADMVTITGSTVNIRRGPGSSYKVFKVSRKGDKFEVVNTSGWMCVKHEDTVCWVSEKYVKDGVCTASSLNVRKGPNTTYDSVGIVKKGHNFTVVNTNGWVPILIDGAIYWVSKTYAK